MPISVYLCDDHAMLRAGLRALLIGARGIDVIGEAGDAETAIEEVVARRPDVAILDITLPGIDGLEAARRIRKGAPDVRVLVLTMHDDPAYLFQALDAGAAGYVLKRAADAELIAAIRSVVMDNAFLAPAAARSLVADYLRRRERGELRIEAERLTPREEEVLALIAQGFTNVEIGDRLVISIKTVETHRSHVLAKLGLRKRAELVHYARTHGLLDRPASLGA